MKYLIDTHTFLWMIDNYNQLSDLVKQTLLDIDNQLYFSKASYWEICLKISIEKLQLSEGWERKIEKEIRANFVKWLEIETKHCEQLIELPWIHRDPFDRMLISQAHCEGLKIITKDETIRLYSIDTIW